ncbi:hypothetical protein [Devosia aurantiaca]|uniref:Uncharacterized protein n=1 Tax=Devosia aurantiaca TaxID=2714858 RepID=A0A6M1SPM5_9HYPH|nr:hypothetical protein [Devosia aurantiaca]NGP19168.1 hypothetical protein [Devosia aurantiaca]
MINSDPIRSKLTAGAAEHGAKNEAKYFLMAGGRYLNQSGQHLQSGRQYAWQGTIEQARRCRSLFDAAAGCRVIPVNALSFTLHSVEEAA